MRVRFFLRYYLSNDRTIVTPVSSRVQPRARMKNVSSPSPRTITRHARFLIHDTPPWVLPLIRSREKQKLRSHEPRASTAIPMHRLVVRSSCRAASAVKKPCLFSNVAAKASTARASPEIRGYQKDGRRSVHTCKNTPLLTKIIATIGPVSEEFEPLQKVQYASFISLIPWVTYD